MEQMGTAITAIAVAVIGVATVAVIVSKQAQTPQVTQAFGSALSTIIQAAVSPVTGSTGATSPMLGNLLGTANGNYGSITPTLGSY